MRTLNITNSTSFGYSPFGMQVVVSPFMTVSKEVEEKRGWKERWFSFPWHPFKKTKLIIRDVPSEDVAVFGNMIICHPVMEARIKQALQNQ